MNKQTGAQDLSWISEKVFYCLSMAPQSCDRDSVRSQLESVLDAAELAHRYLQGRLESLTWGEIKEFREGLSEFIVACRLAFELPGIETRIENMQSIWDQMDKRLSSSYDVLEAVDDLIVNKGLDNLNTDDVVAIQMRKQSHLNPVVLKPSAYVRSPISPDLRADVWDKTRGRCWYCGVEMHPFRNFHVDHYIPVVDGGSNEFDNLYPSCQSCNSRKQARPAEYLRRFIASGKFYGEGLE